MGIRLGFALASACLALFAPLEAGAITKCVDKSGKVTYQDGKCPDDSKQDALKAPIPAAPSASPAPSEGPVDEEALLRLASDQATLDACERASPGFLARNRSDVDAWQAFNATALARYQNTPRYHEMLDNGRTQLRDQMMLPGAAEKIAAFCQAQYLPALRRTIGKS